MISATEQEEWTTLTDLMVAFQSTHSATLRFTLKVDDGGYRSFVAVEATASIPSMTGPGRPLSLSVFSHYPHLTHYSLPSMLYALLLRLDKRVSEELYKQRELPGL